MHLVYFGSFLFLYCFASLYCFFFSFVFFFQAEDGIRDLVRSRGLGDVYKRQHLGRARVAANGVDRQSGFGGHRCGCRSGQRLLRPVSYTHLTLPTSDLV